MNSGAIVPFFLNPPSLRRIPCERLVASAPLRLVVLEVSGCVDLREPKKTVKHSERAGNEKPVLAKVHKFFHVYKCGYKIICLTH